MLRPALSADRFLLASAVFAAPPAAVLLALAMAGRIDYGTAIAGIAVAAAAIAGIAYRYYRELVRLADYLDRLGRADDDVVRPPRPTTALGRGLIAAILHLQRGWQARSRRLSARAEEASIVLQALQDPLVVLDADRQVVQANRAAEALFGDHIAGRDLAEGLRHPAVLALVDAVLKDGGARTLDYTRSVPIEQVFEVRAVRFGRVAPGDGEPDDGRAGGGRRGALVTFHDITAVKRSEQMRADFVANASHELRTPLSTLTGFIETLRGPARDDPDARDRFLSIMHEQAGRMSRLVSDLLSLSRIELDEHTAPPGTVDLLGILRRVIATLEIKAAKRELEVLLHVPESLPPVAGDDDQLMQVFQNLIDNAIKYTRPRTQILVSVTVPEGGPGGRGRRVAVAIRDRGEGIDKAHLPRLTERFYRVDPARSRAMGGTGLGLAIVKHIVSRHRGRLTIDSTVGEGSTFTVLLPLAEPARGGPADGSDAAARTGAGVTKP